MKEKTLGILYFFFLFINILLIPATEQQSSYLPGSYNDFDLFMNDEKNQYLYKAGYYSNFAIPNNYNKAQGITLLHDNSCSSNGSIETYALNNVNLDKALKHIYVNSITSMDAITCNSPIKSFTNPNYELELTIFVVSNSENLFTIQLSDENNSFQAVYGDTINGLQKIKLTFAFNNNNIIVNNNVNFSSLKQIQYSEGVGISMYVVRLLFPNGNPENFSFEGTMACHSTINPCIPGFTCAGGVCQKCDASCLFCEFPNSSTSCVTACNRHASTQTPQLGQCSIEYIDLSQFNNVIVNNIDPPRTNRLTISFWIFDSRDQGTSTKTITIPNYLKVTITSDTQEVICDDLFAGKGQITLNNFEQKKWNFIKCGISNDIKKFSLDVNNGNNIIDLLYPNIFDNKVDNVFNKYFYRFGETITMYLDHVDDISIFPFYVRNLFLFQEYLPQDVMNTKYYALDKFVTLSTLPEILFSLPFDNLSKGSYTYTTKAFTYVTNKEVSVSLIPTTSNPDLNVPNIFERLNLITKPNTKYTSPDLFEETLMPVGEGELFVDEQGDPFSCSNSNYLIYVSNICDKRCPADLLNTAGISYNKGICQFPCDITNTDNLLQCLSTYEFTFQCQSGNFKMYYTCIPNTNDDNYALYYNSKYTPGRIILDFSMYKLKSVFIEFMLYVDNTKYNPNNDGYIFYSNIMRLKQKGNSFEFENTFSGTTSLGNNIVIDAWNHIILQSFYDPLEITDKTKMFFYSIKGFNYIGKDCGTSANSYEFTKIYFCHKDTDCDGLTFSWRSGFYKHLKIWDGNKASPFVANRYVESKPSLLFDSVLAFYPLTGSYISDNKIYQTNRDLTKSTFFYISESFNPWDLQRYNFASEFDTIINTCNNNNNNNCKRCLNANTCYECEDGYFLNQDGKCIELGVNRALRTPIQNNLLTIELPYTDPITVTMWIRLFGFQNGGKDMVYYSNVLKLAYESDSSSEDYGINLYLYRENNLGKCIANYKHFRKYIGQWVFIAVSYYGFSTTTHFPEMMRFEVHNDYVPLKENSVDPTVTFTSISFSSTMHALIKQTRVYNQYIVGALYYETTPCSINRIFQFVPFDNSEPCVAIDFTKVCEDPNTFQQCVEQYFEVDLSVEKTPLIRTTCAGSCNGACFKERDEKSCSSKYESYRSNIYLGNKQNHYSQVLKPLRNFAGVTEGVLNTNENVSLNALTLQFWIFIHNYVDNVFEEYQIEWENFLTVTIYKNSTTITGYSFSCTFMDSSMSLSFEISKWNFIHCSAGDEFMYLNDYNRGANPLKITPFTKQGEVKLIFRDPSDRDWGVVFIKTLRLWSKVFSETSFLSKRSISEDKFEGLLFQTNDDNNDLFPKNSSLHINIIPEEIFSDVFLCKEEGSFYDSNIDGCIHFTDITRIEGSKIEINDVQVSYSHNYGIAFWVLFENTNSLQNEGFVVDWTYHMNIAFQQVNNALYDYCFPQNYDPYVFVTQTPNEKYSLSKIINKSLIQHDNLNGKWQWVTCFVSYYNKIFNFHNNQYTLEPESMYNGVKTDHPFGYFFNNNEKQLSKLTISYTGVTNSKIYMRALYLFNDYLPPSYTNSIKYMNLGVIKAKEFPALNMVINFADYVIDNVQQRIDLQYYKYLEDSKSIFHFNQIITGDNELSSNFVFQPLCNPSNNERYDESTGKCYSISNCNLVGLNALYCMEENTPLVCINHYYITTNEKGEFICSSSCSGNTFRTPGTTNGLGICSSTCPGSQALLTCPNNAAYLLAYDNYFKCKDNYAQINYHCYEKSSSSNIGAFFYSSCNNPHTFELSFTDFTPTSYIVEFWIMIDNVFCELNDVSDYYYFYFQPHIIYKNGNNGFKYKINNQEVSLNDFHQYEWNIIIIEIKEDGSLILYINYKQQPQNNFTGDKLLQKLIFANTNNIKWGSAFYKKIRIWDAKSISFTIIQNYDSKYSSKINGLLLYYPLSLETINSNKFKSIITSQYTSLNTLNLLEGKDSPVNSADKILIYNYSSKFDYIALDNYGNYMQSLTPEGKLLIDACPLGCRRCYNANACYECEDKFILKIQTCVPVSHSFMKTPSLSGKDISLKTISDEGVDITQLQSLSIHFFMKIIGTVSTLTTEYATVVTFNTGTYIAYKPNTKTLSFYVLGATNQNNDVSIENNVNEGTWISVGIATYISGQINSIYPNMFTIAINREDIGMIDVKSNNGVSVTQITFGSHVLALFADLRIYERFYQGVFGIATAKNEIRNGYLAYRRKLYSTDNASCIDIYNDLSTVVEIECVFDDNRYIPVDDNTAICGDNMYDDGNGCVDCNEKCEICYNSEELGCTCDTLDRTYWLIRDINTKTKCERVPYLDFSYVNEITINEGPVSKTKEYSLELWLYIYSYNQQVNNFREVNIEWDNHIKFKIFNENNAVKVTCYPIYSITEPDKYVSDFKTLTISLYKWNHIRCGSDLNTKKFFFDTIVYDLSTLTDDYPEYDTMEYSKIKIFTSKDSYTNFGFIFINEMKLWQQYNYNFIDTKYLDLQKATFVIDNNIFEHLPGLLQYYKNIGDDNFNMYEEKQETILENTIIATLQPKIDYVGYNIVKFNTLNELVPICSLGQVKDKQDDICESQPQSANFCYVSGNTAGKCVICDASQSYLHVVDGSCNEKCPDMFYGNSNINQCRPCHETCLTCDDLYYNSCTSCTGALYLDEIHSTCIPNCESVGLTASLTRPNLCVTFDADASLIEPNDPLQPIDPNVFETISATVFGATATGYTTKWLIDIDETNRINNEIGFNDDLPQNANPFIGDVFNLECELEPSFFKLEHKYVFVLQVIKENKGEIVTVEIKWTLTMNSPPKNGYIKIIPSVGYKDSTTFVISSYDWTDENTDSSQIEYWFSFREKNTQTDIALCSEWSTNNEVYSNFTVRYYQEEYTEIYITVRMRDKYHAETTVTQPITIVNIIGSSLYSLDIVLSNYDLEPGINDMNFLSRSEFLKSVGINPYRDYTVDQTYTKYDISLDGSEIIISDPKCIENSVYCNGNGECDLIDVMITCYCTLGYIGNNCYIEKDSFAKLEMLYIEMFDRVFDVIQNDQNVNDVQYKVMYNLYFAAQTFMQDSNFFTVNLQRLLTYMMNNEFPILMKDIDKFIDFYDFYYRYFMIKQSQVKLSNKKTAGSSNRNYTLILSQQANYEDAFKNSITYLQKAMSYIIKHINNDYYTYRSLHYDIILKQITDKFNETKFFIEDIEYQKSFNPYAQFMSCLKENSISQTFTYWMSYIRFYQFPFSYDSKLYPNTTSSFFIITIYDLNGKEISLSKCVSPIKLFIPFHSYEWTSYMNAKMELFIPANYKVANDPIFKDPIFIHDNGKVSNDTIDMRIEKYYREYNITGLRYDTILKQFSYDDIVYLNYSMDAHYYYLESRQLGAYTAMMLPNKVEFVTDGRFFYLKKYMIFAYFPNYLVNYAFYVFFILLFFIFVGSLVYYCYDYKFFKQQNMLEFLKKEIIKANLPYIATSKINLNDYIPKISNNGDKGKNKKTMHEIRHMFDNIDFNSEGDDDDDDVDSNIKQHKEKPIMSINDIGNEKPETLNIKINKQTQSDEDGGYDNSNNVSDFHSSNNSNSNNNKHSDKKRKINEVVKYKSTHPVDIIETTGNNSYYESASSNEYSSTHNHNKQKHKQYTKKNNYFLDKNKTKTNPMALNILRFEPKRALDVGELPEDYENEKEEKEKTMEAYANLTISTCEFIVFNIKHRHLLINPLLNKSLFNPRWKKFFLLGTQFHIIMVLLSVWLTFKENISLTKSTLIVIVMGLVTTIASNIVMYLLVFFFVTSKYQRKRLFRFVTKGEQLIVLKSFQKIQKTNCCWGFFGMVLCICIWLGSIYISFGFVAVWKYQNSAWITAFCVGVLFELVICELLIEVLIGLFFAGRKKSICIRNFGEWCNRVRSYRTLWP